MVDDEAWVGEDKETEGGGQRGGRTSLSLHRIPKIELVSFGQIRALFGRVPNVAFSSFPRLFSLHLSPLSPSPALSARLPSPSALP